MYRASNKVSYYMYKKFEVQYFKVLKLHPKPGPPPCLSFALLIFENAYLCVCVCACAVSVFSGRHGSIVEGLVELPALLGPGDIRLRFPQISRGIDLHLPPSPP